jgi:hypothetical protein
MAGLLLALAAGSVRAAPVTIALQPFLDQDHLALTLDAPGDGKALFMFDTGGGVTLVSPDFARRLGCKPWGRVTGFRMRGDRLDLPRCDGAALTLGGKTRKLPSALVLDLARFLPKDAPTVSGSLALDSFAGEAVTLDLAGRRLIVETPASLKARTAHAIEAPARYSREAGGLSRIPLIGVPTPKGMLWMELDCGSDGPIILAAHAAEALGLEPARKTGQTVSAALVPGLVLQGKAQVEDLILDGNIGAPILRRWIITFDLAHERLWLSPAGG